MHKQKVYRKRKRKRITPLAYLMKPCGACKEVVQLAPFKWGPHIQFFIHKYYNHPFLSSQVALSQSLGMIFQLHHKSGEKDLVLLGTLHPSFSSEMVSMVPPFHIEGVCRIQLGGVCKNNIGVEVL